jgi:hypothetical protein
MLFNILRFYRRIDWSIFEVVKIEAFFCTEMLFAEKFTEKRSYQIIVVIADVTEVFSGFINV